ncbi:MAG: adenylate kinase [Pseudomonadota bacterium]
MNKQKETRLVFLGPPGCGKGTQAKRVSQEYKIIQLSTGDMLRQAIADKTEVGLKAKSLMDVGELVPNEVVIGIMKIRMAKPDCSQGYILDGFPRSLKQAESLSEMLKESSQVLSAVINFSISDEEVISRLTGRRVCKACGGPYHVKFNPPKEDGVCDQCKGELYQRDDDNEETVKNRLQVYRRDTEPLVSYYKSLGLLHDLKGDGDIDTIFSDLCSLINRLREGS